MVVGLYGRSTMSMICTGSAVSRAYKAGVKYGNAEFIQVHPTAVPGADKLRLMRKVPEVKEDESGFHENRRTPVTKDIPVDEGTTFLKNDIRSGNLVPRDIATREIFDICTTDGPVS